MTANAAELQFGPSTLTVRTDLTDYDKQFVPSWDDSYYVDEAIFETLAICAAEDFNCLVVGPTGAGKSTAIMMLAALLNQPVRRINLHGDIRSADFLGEKTLDVVVDAEGHSQTVTIWRDGVVPDALRRGHWLILDEFDACPASVGMVAQSVLEPGHPLTLSANHGEEVVVDSRARIFGTANTLGRGDDSGLYAGTNVMNEATLDRWVVMAQGYLAPDLERDLLVDKTGLNATVAGLYVQVAGEIRKEFEKPAPGCFCTLSTRRLIVWATLTMRFLGAGKSKAAWKAAEKKGYTLAVGNKLGPEDKAFVAGVTNRILAVTLPLK